MLALIVVLILAVLALAAVVLKLAPSRNPAARPVRAPGWPRFFPWVEPMARQPAAGPE